MEPVTIEDSPQEQSELTPAEKAKRWMEFVAAYSVNVPFPVDDSRESIYTREDKMV